jgi:hypothetical protein
VSLALELLVDILTLTYELQVFLLEVREVLHQLAGPFERVYVLSFVIVKFKQVFKLLRPLELTFILRRFPLAAFTLAFPRLLLLQSNGPPFFTLSFELLSAPLSCDVH